MNIKRFAISSVVVFLLIMGMDQIIHGIILGEIYRSLSSIWRPDMMDFMWIMLATSAVLSIGFVYIFIKGRENKGIAEGVRYGAVMGLLFCGTGSFNQYVIYPVTLSLAVQWFVFGLIEFIIAGIAVSIIYKD
ncbi:MAG TPA: hypothetical protein P5346_10855 [Spirochaetota bacterium]|nr:hypothetical protein [Spirochaetota bacterium]HSA15227.1 hypothetical protein [Spirochaetota bacterium]